MIENYSLPDLLGIDLDTRYPAFTIDNLKSSFSDLQIAAEDFVSSQDSDNKYNKRDKLNKSSWNFLETLFWAKIAACPDLNNSLIDNMTNEEKFFINFGFLSEKISKTSPQELISYINDKTDCESDLLHPLFLCEYFDTLAHNLVKVPDLDRLKETISALEKDYQEKEKEVNNSKREHISLLQALHNSDKLLKLQQKMDELIPALCSVSALRSFSPTKYKQFQKLTEALNRIRILQEKLIPSYCERKSLKESLNRFLAGLTSQKKLEYELTSLRNQISNLSDSFSNLSDEDLFIKVNHEFSNLRKVISLLNKHTNTKYPQLFLEEPPFWTPQKIKSKLIEIYSIDERLRQFWTNKKWEKPNVVILPGMGFPYYDFKSNILWLPFSSHEIEFCPFTRCIGFYRFYCDIQEQTSFGRLNTFKRFTKLSELANVFAQTYERYIKLESKGFRKLSDEARKWFSSHLIRSG